MHSHMLAALPDRRHRVGFAPARAARLALEQGIDVVRWTFDPLDARNAYSTHKLGRSRTGSNATTTAR